MQMENECAHCLPGNCLLQRAAEAGNEAAALFLATSGAQVNHRNKWVSVPGRPGKHGGSVGERQWLVCGENSFFSFCLHNTCTWLENQGGTDVLSPDTGWLIHSATHP